MPPPADAHGGCAVSDVPARSWIVKCPWSLKEIWLTSPAAEVHAITLPSASVATVEADAGAVTVSRAAQQAATAITAPSRAREPSAADAGSWVPPVDMAITASAVRAIVATATSGAAKSRAGAGTPGVFAM